MLNALEDFDLVNWTLDEIVHWIDPIEGPPPAERLLKALQAGHISATGRRVISCDDFLGSRPPELRQREEIREFLWADLKISPYDQGQHGLCVLEMHADRWRPAWHDVLVKRQQVLAFWVPRGPPGFERPVTSIRTGLPGRPSSKNLYEKKLAERIEAGELSQSLEEEARFLRDWLQKTHPTAPPGGLSALRNIIRRLYNKGKSANA